MNIIDKVVGYFSPAAGAVRARHRREIRIYEGAQGGRRGSAWRSNSNSQNSELTNALQPLRNRARELGRNSPIAARMLDIMPAHVVGEGIIPVCNTGEDGTDKQVNDLWKEWVKQADVTGHLNFYAMQVLAVRSMIESGEIVARFIDTEFVKNGPVPLQLQLLEADFIDHYRDGIYGGSAYPDTGVSQEVLRTRLGVALGAYDAWQGLWLWPFHPGETTTVTGISLTSKFVERKDLLHVFKMIRPGQVRGVSWFAPILMTARELADFIDAVNVKARVEACFAGFIQNDDSTMPIMDVGNSPAIIDPSDPSMNITSIEPGMLKELRTGQTITFAQPTSNVQIDPMLLYNLQAMAAGVGCTYDQATGDLRQANYSSLRAGKLDFWRLIGQIQNHIVIPQFCEPVWDRFIRNAILAGKLKARKTGYPCDWIVPAREAIDPKKDLDAEKNEVRSGRMTPQEFIASKGGNWRNTLDQFKSFFDRADELGLVFDTDVRKVDQHGRQPPTPGEEDPNATSDQASDDAKDDGDFAKEDD